jgi:signal transduction histidine kinase
MSSGDDTPDDSPPGRLQGGFETVAAGLDRLLPEYVRRSYLLKFVLALLIVVAAIAGVGVSAWAATTDTLNDQISGQLETSAERDAQNIHQWRDQRQVWIQDLSRVHTGRGLDDFLQMQTRLQDSFDTFPDDVRAVHMVNITSSNIRASSDTASTGTTLSETDTPWAQGDISTLTTDSDGVFVSDVYVSSGRQVIAFVTEIPQTGNAALVGIVESQQFITAVPPERGRFTTVVDTETGSVVMANRLADGEQVGHEMIGQPYGDEAALRTIQQTTSARYLGQAPNQESLDEAYVAAAAPVPETNFVVVSHAPENEAFAVREDIVSQLILLVVVSLVGLTLIGVVIAGGTVRSLKRLTAKANELEEGNLDVELSTNRADEIGQLYHGFDSMRESLRTRISDLSDAMETEEQMRKELAKTNEELEDQRIIISVLNRLLRHNLRNSLTSILLHSEQIADGPEDDYEEHVERIITVSQQLMRHAEKSQAIEKIIDIEADKLGVVDVTAIVEDSTTAYEDKYPDAAVLTTAPETAYARGGDAITFVVDNLVENALEHNDQSDPHVWVNVEAVTEEDQQWIEVCVEDDGPGIPEMETNVLERGEETPLEHGSGIGLWLVNWLVEHMNGEVWFEQREPRGARVRVRIPKADNSERSGIAESGIA